MTTPSQPGPPPGYPQGPGPQGGQPYGQPGAGPRPDGTQPGQPGQPPAKKRSVSFGQILGGLLFVLVVIFIVENSQKVKIRLIVPIVHAPLYVAILIAAVLGALIAGLLRYRRRVSARRKQIVREHRSEGH